MKRFQKWLILGAASVFGLACHVNAVADGDSPMMISGKVRDPSGAPAASVVVTFHPGQFPGAPQYAEVRTDKDGRYEMILKNSEKETAWSGSMNLINSVLARDLSRNLAAIQEFAARPTNVDLSLQPGITLKGYVKDTNGAPISSALVSLSFESGQMFSEVEPHPAKVDEQGFFSIPALPRGRNYHFFHGDSGGITAPGYGSTGAFLQALNTQTSHYEFHAFVLKKADYKIAGRVLCGDRNPFPGATVFFMAKGQQPEDSSKTQTDGQGRFSFDGLCEGSFVMFAQFHNSFLNIKGKSVKVQAGDTNLILQLKVPHLPIALEVGAF